LRIDFLNQETSLYSLDLGDIMFYGLSEWYEGTEQVVDSMIRVLRWVRLSEKS